MDTILPTHIEQFDELVNTYKLGKKQIEEIIGQAKSEHTQWLDVIEEFNRRFIMFPFVWAGVKSS